MMMAARNAGLCDSNLKVSGDEMLYGIFATHTSKYGRSTFITSAWMICSWFWYGVPCTRRCSSSTIRGSNSTATTLFACSRSFMVRFPVPGPISSTTSVDLSPDFSTMDCTTSGFFRMC